RGAHVPGLRSRSPPAQRPRPRGGPVTSTGPGSSRGPAKPVPGARTAAMAPASLSAEDVQDILRLLDTLPFDELTLETSHFTLRLQRAAGGGWAQQTHAAGRPGEADGRTGPVATGAAAPVQPAPPTDPAPPTGPLPAAEPTPAGTGPERDLREVRAPLLGTFYRAPQPGAPPYVDVGSLVAP